MSLKHLFSVSIAVMLLLSLTVLGVFLKYGDAVSEERAALAEQKKAVALSEEMAGDSRGLTDNIRLYGLTGEPRYKDAYNRILAESNGKEARSDGTVISFMEKVEKFGVSKEELKALNDAKSLSNGLAVIETEVMNAIDARIVITGSGESYRENLDLATVQQLVRLFDDDYYLWIGKIAEAVGRFNKSLFSRTGNKVAESQRNEEQMGRYFFIVLGVFITFNIGLLLFLWRNISRTLGGEPKLMEEVATRIAVGDLAAAHKLDRSAARGVAKAMLEINDSLERLVAEMSGSLDQIKRGNLRMACDESKFTGAYKGLLTSTNQLMANIVSYFDLIATPIMCVDTEYNILFINKNGADLGNKQPVQLQGTKCHDLFRTDACKKSDCICHRAMKANGITTGSTIARPMGKELIISYSSAPIKSDSGEVIGAFEQVFDETAIKTSQHKMIEVAGNATNIADRLASAAEELSSQIEQSSNGSDMQRERVGETATAMEQMNATVLEVAQNASHAADSAEHSRASARQGSGVVGELIESIQLAEKTANGLKEQMAALGEQAQGIGGIMNVISDIADQTNLLALNAAIEAARAGDAGRGFAVVADEVRKLAEKTMVATNEVSKAVGSIQSGTQASITSTDEAVEAIMRSTEFANSSQGELSKIVGYAETTADQVRSIATSAEEQSAVAEQITRATDEVNQIALDVAQAMQQSTQAVHELAALAGELQELISELTRD